MVLVVLDLCLDFCSICLYTFYLLTLKVSKIVEEPSLENNFPLQRIIFWPIPIKWWWDSQSPSWFFWHGCIGKLVHSQSIFDRAVGSGVGWGAGEAIARSQILAWLWKLVSQNAFNFTLPDFETFLRPSSQVSEVHWVGLYL